jgi:predicted nucleotide-binding protein
LVVVGIEGTRLVFVLFNADDKRIIGPDAENEAKRRARQNVNFELGSFVSEMLGS